VFNLQFDGFPTKRLGTMRPEKTFIQKKQKMLPIKEKWPRSLRKEDAVQTYYGDWSYLTNQKDNDIEEDKQAVKNLKNSIAKVGHCVWN
jgi:hypothetical protein